MTFSLWYILSYLENKKKESFMQILKEIYSEKTSNFSNNLRKEGEPEKVYAWIINYIWIFPKFLTKGFG